MPNDLHQETANGSGKWSASRLGSPAVFLALTSAWLYLVCLTFLEGYLGHFEARPEWFDLDLMLLFAFAKGIVTSAAIMAVMLAILVLVPEEHKTTRRLAYLAWIVFMALPVCVKAWDYVRTYGWEWWLIVWVVPIAWYAMIPMALRDVASRIMKASKAGRPIGRWLLAANIPAIIIFAYIPYVGIVYKYGEQSAASREEALLAKARTRRIARDAMGYEELLFTDGKAGLVAEVGDEKVTYVYRSRANGIEVSLKSKEYVDSDDDASPSRGPKPVARDPHELQP